MLMKHKIECMRVANHGIGEVRFSNSVRKYKEVLLSFELNRSNGMHLVTCGRNEEEDSCI